MLAAKTLNNGKLGRLLGTPDVSGVAPRRGLPEQASKLASELEELKAEREAAQEAAKAALRRLGWR
ncbi:hypothetical protein OAF73_00780 [Planctomycetota bacterium]|nr:hypothetical protein [Planctomycetota bacterium]